MQNRLKGVTKKVVRELQLAEVRTIMATGDNMRTAVAVGKKCGVIDSEGVMYMGDIVGKTGGIQWVKIGPNTEEEGEVVEGKTKQERIMPWEFEEDEEE
jgi:magnesium-transporting ATPase (P-type)